MSGAGTFWLLDDVCGWRGELRGLSVTGEGRDLTVDSFPGLAVPLPPKLHGALNCPGPMCAGAKSAELYAIEELGARVRMLEFGSNPRVKTLPGIGGAGAAHREFNRPQGIALLSDGSLLVSDTKNNRIQVFTPFPHALTAVWNRGLKQPWGVAVGACDVIYVADRGNGRVVKFNREGIQQDQIQGLKSPSAIAVAPDGTLAIVDGSSLCVFVKGKRLACVESIVNLTSVIFDSDGILYVGSSDGLVYKYAIDATTVLRQLGIGVLGRDGGVGRLSWVDKVGLVASVTQPCARPVLYTIPTTGGYAPQGQLLSAALDSVIEQCSWNRMEIDGSLPDGSSIVVETQSSATEGFPDDVFSAPLVLSSGGRDILIQSPPGRYLRFRITLRTNGKVTPSVHNIKLLYPRESYLQYLPAVYQEDSESRDFLDRFLSIFQTSFDGFDGEIDQMWQYFDPIAVPSKWFNWLAGWLALPINPLWKDAQRRNVLKGAAKVYQKRGTVAGLEQLILDYAGIQGSIVEHFRLRRLTILSASNRNLLGSGLRLWSRDFYGRLQLETYSRLGYFRLTGEPEPGIEALVWGANQFSVLFSADPYCVDDTRKAVVQVVEREKPAHTQACYTPIFARFRVGVQSTLGVDARVGEISHIVLKKVGTLGYDSILSCSETTMRIRTFGAAATPQTGVNSRLL
jgi:phage tail protein domain